MSENRLVLGFILQEEAATAAGTVRDPRARLGWVKGKLLHMHSKRKWDKVVPQRVPWWQHSF